MNGQDPLIKLLVTPDLADAVVPIAQLATQTERLAALRDLVAQSWDRWDGIIKNQNRTLEYVKSVQQAEITAWRMMSDDDPAKANSAARIQSRAADWPALDLPEELKPPDEPAQ